MALISASILSADFARLGEQVSMIDASGADRIHIDVMDGRFVPVITIGPAILSAIRPFSRLPMDVHLMIVEPERHIEAFIKAGADSITVHAEGNPHLDRILRSIRERGIRAGVSLNPGTSLHVLDHLLPLVDLVLLMTVNPGYGGQSYLSGMTPKIASLRALIDDLGLPVEIQLDGGIGLENVSEVTNVGAQVLVTGSAFFSSGDPVEFVSAMKRSAARGTE